MTAHKTTIISTDQQDLHTNSPNKSEASSRTSFRNTAIESAYSRQQSANSLKTLANSVKTSMLSNYRAGKSTLYTRRHFLAKTVPYTQIISLGALSAGMIHREGVFRPASI